MALPFSIDEYAGRLRRARSTMDQRSLAALFGCTRAGRLLSICLAELAERGLDERFMVHHHSLKPLKTPEILPAARLEAACLQILAEPPLRPDVLTRIRGPQTPRGRFSRQ